MVGVTPRQITDIEVSIGAMVVGLVEHLLVKDVENNVVLRDNRKRMKREKWCTRISRGVVGFGFLACWT
ncbi:hypothetical protein VNO80_06278 [Phaseolus coccineus]|uniref:Uncharacterized protein n=1 Tax=Phaseolus coccineus TaxID=3886 RepID=A0AAN9RNQ9_PHACN